MISPGGGMENGQDSGAVDEAKVRHLRLNAFQ